jgi:hypothetical protein
VAVVEINENWYIATRAHVIINEELNCTKKIVEKIMDVNENDISYSPYALVYKKGDIDAALILLTNIKKIKRIVKPLKVPSTIISFISLNFFFHYSPLF